MKVLKNINNRLRTVRRLIYLIIFLIIMQSCDKMYKYHYKVENNTNSSLVIHYVAENYSKIDTVITILTKHAT